MESSPSSTSLQYQFRSISLPSRLHPCNTTIDVGLTKLKTWHSSLVSSTVPASGETIRNGLVVLADLYSCVEELIRSPITQKALIEHRNRVLVEETLEGSIGFLDSCSVTRDLLLMMREMCKTLGLPICPGKGLCGGRGCADSYQDVSRSFFSQSVFGIRHQRCLVCGN